MSNKTTIREFLKDVEEISILLDIRDDRNQQVVLSCRMTSILEKSHWFERGEVYPLNIPTCAFAGPSSDGFSTSLNMPLDLEGELLDGMHARFMNDSLEITIKKRKEVS